MQLIARILIAGSVLLAVQAQARDGAMDGCGEHSQAGIRDCLSKKVEEGTAQLKQAEDQAAQAIAKWDEDAKYVKAAKARLQTASAAFKKYSQAQCAFVSALGGGAIGNALENRRMACVVDLTAARVAQLTADTASLPQK